MAKSNGRGMQALFQSVGDDGTTWRFVIHEEDKWSITRDGKPVDVGPADRLGIAGGVRQFLRLAGRVEPKLQTATAATDRDGGTNRDDAPSRSANAK
jgi:hypothetical protein